MSAEQITPVSGPYKGKTGELVFRYDDGSADVQFNVLQGYEYIPRDDMPPTFEAYAWPGGYPLAYYPRDEWGSTTGDVLCPACAKKEYQDWLDARAETLAGDFPEDAPDMSEHPKCLSNIEEEVHSTIYCDECSQPFIFQNWCDFCQESVETDEEQPFHRCKPRKWQVTYQHNPSIRPRVDRHATREQARDNARRYKQAGYAVATVAPIHPPIMPEN